MILRIIVFSLILFTSGCIIQKSATYNQDIAQNLPPEVALEYIRTLRFSVWDCDFNLTTMEAMESGQYPYSNFNVKIMSSSLIVFLDRELSRKIGGYIHECYPIVTGAEQVKAVTALKVLGIKTP